MLRCAWVAVLLGGCHTVINHNPGGASDLPRDRALSDQRLDGRPDRSPFDAAPDGPRTDARLDAPRLDLADGPRLEGPRSDRADGPLPSDGPRLEASPTVDVAPPPDVAPAPDQGVPALGAPCGNGTTSPGCCSSSKWCWQSPLPQGNDLNALWAFAPDDVVFVGNHGTILHWYKGQFYRDSVPVTHDLHAVFGIAAPRTLYAVGTSGTILKRTAASATWTSQPSGTTAFLRGVHGRSASELYAVGNGPTILRGNGTSWSVETWGGVTNALFAVHAAQTAVYVGGLDGLWSKSGGVVKHHGDDVRGIWVHGPDAAASVGATSVWRKSISGWGLVSGATGTPYAAVWGNGTSYWLVGKTGISELMSSGTLLLRQNALEHWAIGGSTVAGPHVVAAGRRGAIQRTSGASWSPQSTHLAQGPLTGIWGSAANDLWAVGGGGEIFRFDGAAWTLHHSYQSTTYPGTVGYVAISGTKNATKSYRVAVGAGTGGSPHASAHLTDLAAPAFAGAPVPLKGVWVEAVDKAHATTDAGVYTWNGAFWSAAHGFAALAGIWGFANASLLAVGPTQACYRVSGAWTCTTHTTGSDELRAVWGFDSGSPQKDVFAVGLNRIVQGTLTTILTWNNVNAVPPASLRSVWGRSMTEIYAVGDGGVILSRGLSIWSPEVSGTSKALYGVYLPPAATAPCAAAWAVGDTGTILCRKP
jgi:hypothetical protein